MEPEPMTMATASLTIALAKKGFSPEAVGSLQQAVETLPNDYLTKTLENATDLWRFTQHRAARAVPQPQQTANPPPAPPRQALEAPAGPSEAPTGPSKGKAAAAGNKPAGASKRPADPPGDADTSKKRHQTEEQEEEPEEMNDWKPAGNHSRTQGAGITAADRVELPDFDAAEEWNFPDLPEVQQKALHGWEGEKNGLGKQFGLGLQQLKTMATEVCTYTAEGSGLYTPTIVQRILNAPMCDAYLFADEKGKDALAKIAREDIPLTVQHAVEKAAAYHRDHIRDKQAVAGGRKFHLPFFKWYTTARNDNALWESRNTWGPAMMALWVWHNIFSREIDELRAKNKKKKQVA